MMFNMTQTNIAILCEVDVDTETNTVVLYYDVGYDSRGKFCHLVWCAECETEKQTLSSCVTLNATERQIAIEVCERDAQV